MSPQKIYDDLVKQLTQWRKQGDRLIGCIDANEHIYKKSMGKSLTDSQGLAMKEVVGSFTNEPLGATFFRGTKPIDGVWATSDIVVTGACVMPVGYGVGDHRMFVVDFFHLISRWFDSSTNRACRSTTLEHYHWRSGGSIHGKSR